MKTGRVCVGCGFLLAAAAIVFFGGVETLLCLAAASAVHEAGHLAVLRAFGVRAEKIKLGVSGAVIIADTSRLTFVREALAAAAGPAAGIAAAIAAARFFSAFAGTSMALSLLNLLPCGSLDGGRILRAVLLTFAPPAAVDTAVTVLTCAAVLAFALLAVLAETPAASVTFLITAVCSSAGLTRGDIIK